MVDLSANHLPADLLEDLLVNLLVVLRVDLRCQVVHSLAQLRRQGKKALTGQTKYA